MVQLVDMVQPVDIMQGTVHIQIITIIAHMEDMVQEDMVHHIIVMAHHTQHIHHITDTVMALTGRMGHMDLMDRHIIDLDMEE
jgi:hypothetical protein